MAETLLTLTGTEVTVDESAGLQTSGVATTTEDNNDSDVTALSSAIATQLATAAGADGKTIPGTATGFAVSNGNVVTVNSTGLDDIAFTDSAGAPLNGADSGLTTLAGNRILLFSSGSNNNIVYGIEENTGDLVFALILEETKTGGVTTGAKIWTALYEPISHTVDGAPSIANHDDALDLTDKLYVTASEDLTFNFDQLPSGSNLFGVVGTSSTAPAIIVIGENIDLKADGKFSNTSDVIHTSQGGTGATIGVNNQLFDNVSEGAYFTYVNNPNPNFLSGVPGGLSSTEADFAQNIQYTGGTLEVTTAFFAVTQMQGNSLADAKITAYDIGDSPQGLDFVNGANGLGTGTPRPIAAVRVFNAAGTLVETSDGTVNSPTVSITITNGVATVTGLDDNYRVEWDTTGLHDRVLIENVAGQFDIGLFGLKQVGSDTDEVGSKVNFEDDGPTAAIALTGAAVAHDETPGVQADANDTTAAAVVGLFTGVSNKSTDLSTAGFAQNGTAIVSSAGSSSGTDAAGATTVFSLAVSSAGVDSGLDTTDGTSILLFKEGALVVGRIGGAAGAAAFAVAIDSASGQVSIAQWASIKHPTGGASYDESVAVDNAALQAVVTVTDGDGDTDTKSVNIGAKVQIQDDGPTAAIALTGAAVAHDETAGVQGDANDTTDPAVVALFSGVSNKSTDLSAAGFAHNASAVVSSAGSSTGVDQEAATTAFSLAVSAAGVDSGLDTTDGTSIFLFKESALVVGRIGGAAGAAAFAVAIDSATGEVSIAQWASIKHPTGGASHDESVAVNNAALQAVVTVTDGDGDIAANSVNIGAKVQIQDDGPAIGPIANSIVDFAVGSTATKTLAGVAGEDGNAGYTITSFTSSVVVNGVTVKGELSADAHTVTYFEDKDNSGTFNTGDTKFYTLDLNQTGAGAYTFTVFTTPAPTELVFGFDELPSGQNLFGMVGPSSSDPGLIIFGKAPVLNADGTFTNASDTINTSQGGGPTTIGVNNQMFDPGEGAYFIFIEDPNANFLAGAPGGLTQGEADDADNMLYGDGQGGTFDLHNVNTAFLKISQIQGNALASLSITAATLADDFQGSNLIAHRADDNGTPSVITAVRVFNAAGTKIEDTGDLAHFNSPTVSVSISAAGVATVNGLDAGYKVEWDTSAADPFNKVLVQGVSGKFDIGGFGTIQQNPTPDQKLDFTAKITDGDTDTSSANFSVGIDGTGIFDDGIVLGV